MKFLIMLFLIYNLFKKPSNYLNCGLFAWNGKYPSSFDTMKFKILGIFNDLRGGDSCGIYTNGEIYKGIHTVSKFKDFWKEFDFSKTKNAKVVIGHARKASVGHVSYENAQPIGISFKSAKLGKRGIVVAHNGTLTNHAELAVQYNLDIKDLSTDTQVLSYLLYYNGWKVLQEYEGSAALIITLSHEPDTMYVFKGASKIWPGSVNLSEERPLYYYQENKNSIYFSSMEDSLITLLTDPSTESLASTKKVKELPENILFKIKNGVMTEIQKIDRNKIKAPKTKVYKNNKFYNNEGAYNLYNNRIDEYENAASWSSIEKSKVIVEKEALNTEFWSSKNSLYYVRMRYYLDSTLVTGSYFVTSCGDAYANLAEAMNQVTTTDEIRKLYFYRGILLKDRASYHEVLKIVATLKASDVETYKIIIELQKYSVYPIHIKTNDSGYIYKQIENVTSKFYTGSFKPMFSDREYVVKNGDLQKITSHVISTKNTQPLFYFPDFNSNLNIWVDSDSAGFNHNMCDLGYYEFEFPTVATRTSVAKTEAKRLKEEASDVKSIKSSTISDKNKEDKETKMLVDKINELQKELIDVTQEFQEDLLGVKDTANVAAYSIYNKISKFHMDLETNLAS